MWEGLMISVSLQSAGWSGMLSFPFTMLCSEPRLNASLAAQLLQLKLFFFSGFLLVLVILSLLYSTIQLCSKICPEVRN